jgi:hypothetical protein
MALPDEKPGAFGIDHAMKSLRDHLDTVLANLRQDMKAGFACLERAVNNVPTRQDFDQAKQALGQAINDAATRINADLQALRDQIAAGNPVTDQDIADIQADTTALGQLDPAVVPPPSP